MFDPFAKFLILFLKFMDRLFEAIVSLAFLDHVEREFFDLGEELRLHVAQADALLFDFGFGGDLGEVVVGVDVGGDLREGFEAVVRLEVKDMPLFIINDVYGGDLYEAGVTRERVSVLRLL